MVGRTFSTTEVLTLSELSQSDRDDMFSLFSRYYLCEGPEYFFRDLEKKSHIFLLRDDAGTIQGFSSLLVYQSVYQNDTVQVFYSGDTIIHESFRGGMQFPLLWIRTILEMASEAEHPSYWFLISGGYRTYRYLSLFTKQYYPGIPGRNAPEWEPLAHHLAEQMFPEDYDRSSGIIRFKEGATPLIPEQSHISEQRLKNRHIEFFQSRNPGHRKGDELVCIAHIDRNNLTEAIFRVAGEDLPV